MESGCIKQYKELGSFSLQKLNAKEYEIIRHPLRHCICINLEENIAI